MKPERGKPSQQLAALQQVAVADVRAGGDGDVVALHHVEPAARPAQEVERRGQHQIDRAGRRPQQVPDQPHVVVHRQPAAADVVRGDLEVLDDRPHVGGDAAVRQHHAARRAGRARGELDHRDVVGVRGVGVEAGARIQQAIVPRHPRLALQAGFRQQRGADLLDLFVDHHEARLRHPHDGADVPEVALQPPPADRRRQNRGVQPRDHRAEERGHQRPQALAHDRQAVARLAAHVDQTGGDALRLLLDLGPGEAALVFVDEDQPAAAAGRGRLPQDLGQGVGKLGSGTHARTFDGRPRCRSIRSPPAASPAAWPRSAPSSLRGRRR